MENPITCVRCKKSLPPDQFNRHSRNRGEIKRSYCRACAKALDRKTRSSGYETYLRYLIRKNKSSSTERGISDYTITAESLKELWEKQGGKCAISGVILTHHLDGTGRKEFNASIDRIDSQLGYVPGNVQLVAYRANVLKNDLGLDMLYWWVKTIYQYSCD